MTDRRLDSDIAVIGGGLSGTIAAIVLGRAGYRVTLIDRNKVFPPEFRVEKIAGDQVARFERLGLRSALAANAVYFDRIANVRHGRLIDVSRTPHYGILYHDLVAAMRCELPANVRLLVDRVVDLQTSGAEQTVTLGANGSLRSRLVVLASGMSDLLRSRLGIERQLLHERQSLSFGFTLRRPGGLAFPAFTYYGEQPTDGIDYMSVFPIRDGLLRANLFAFMDHRSPWVKELRSRPAAALASALPGLRRFAGELELVDRVQNWIMDLSVARNVRQPGIVLIGDAYQTSCPAAGTGVSRVLSDVERLCTVHVPAWLATAGMEETKIAAYYDDPLKQAMDVHALSMADFRRRFTIDTSPSWYVRRQAQFLRRRMMHHIDRVNPGVAAGIRRLRIRH